MLRHSTAHVLAEAVTRLFPGAKYAIGPAIADGFYYDFDLPGGATFTDDDLARIDAEMRAIIARGPALRAGGAAVDDGLALFADQPYKREIIEKVRTGGASGEDAGEAGGDAGVSVYRNDRRATVDFVDLCRGPHVPSTERLGALQADAGRGRLLAGQRAAARSSSASTAPRGSRRQRWPSTCTGSKRPRARDHRKLGVELDLFSFPPEIGSGLAVFHPKGALVRRIMEEYSRQRHEAAGYEFVNTPHITKAELFETSGHLDWFAEGMFPPMELDEGQRRYYLKPMNCPFHILIYKQPAALLPRAAAAALRVRHRVPLREVGRGARAHACARHDPGRRAHLLHQGADGRRARVAARLRARPAARLRPRRLLPRALDQAAGQGRRAPTRSGKKQPRRCASPRVGKGLELVIDEGGGAFYGPKISVQARDAIGRTWQMSTIQLDFQTAAALRHRTTSAPTTSAHRPIMIHRALFGSIERFFGDARRALRRRVSRVARAGAGHGAPRRRPPRRVRGGGRRRSPRRRVPRRDARRRRGRARRADPPGEDREGSARARGRRLRRRARHRGREHPRQRPRRAGCAGGRVPRPPGD